MTNTVSELDIIVYIVYSFEMKKINYKILSPITI